ncbi:MAG: hypothetical protein V3U87_11415 [Methylococcaceae bacterium]
MIKEIKYITSYALIFLSLQLNAKEIKIYHAGASVDLKFYTLDKWDDTLSSRVPKNHDLTFLRNEKFDNDYQVILFYDRTYSNYSDYLVGSPNGDYYILGIHLIICNGGLRVIQKLAFDVVTNLIQKKGMTGYKILIIKYPTHNSPTQEMGNCQNVGSKDLQTVAEQYNFWVDQAIKQYHLENLVYSVDPWKNNFNTLDEGVRIHPTNFAIKEAQIRVHECIKAIQSSRFCK